MDAGYPSCPGQDEAARISLTPARCSLGGGVCANCAEASSALRYKPPAMRQVCSPLFAKRSLSRHASKFTCINRVSDI